MRFKPEDFINKYLEVTAARVHDAIISNCNNTTISEHAADIANQKLEEWLKNAPTVKGEYLPNSSNWRSGSLIKKDFGTHQAKLVCIEIIEQKKCEHTKIIIERDAKTFNNIFCYECNKRVAPTGWKEVE